MADDRDIHETLVTEIKKYECIYNHTIPEYSQKASTDKAWVVISKKTGLSVPDCKEKWRNIRSSFLRSLKPSGSKIKKPYYLRKRLAFILPYVKTQKRYVRLSGDQGDDIKPDVDTLLGDEARSLFVDKEQEELCSSPAPSASSEQSQPSARRKMSSDVDIMVSRRRKLEQDEALISKNGPMYHFFLSLLPEFTNMTEQKTRTFKIKVLQLIDELKQSAPP